MFAETMISTRTTAPIRISRGTNPSILTLAPAAFAFGTGAMDDHGEQLGPPAVAATCRLDP